MIEMDTHDTKIAMILSASSNTNSSCKERHLIKGPYGSSDFASDCCDKLWYSGRLDGSATEGDIVSRSSPLVGCYQPASMFEIPTRTACTVSTFCSFRKRSMYSLAYIGPCVANVAALWDLGCWNGGSAHKISRIGRGLPVFPKS